jgi:phosphoenolpyruvate-protein kinase (PTS system EI component)
LFATLLVGLGLTEISISPPSIPEIKKAIRELSFEECKKIAAEALTMVETDAIVGFLRDRMPKDAASEYT